MRIDLTNKVYMNIPATSCYKDKKDYVMQVIAPQPTGSIGGSDMHVIELSVAQKNNSNLAPIVLFKRNSDYEKRLLDSGLAYICGISASDEEIAQALDDIHAYINIVIIHSHQYDANFLTVTIKKHSKRFLSTRTVMTCHGWIENTEKDVLETEKDFDSYYYADALIAVCSKDYRRLKNDCRSKTKSIFCIRNGVSIHSLNKRTIEECAKQFRRNNNIPASKRILSYVGRLAKEKRLDLIIKTFAVIKDRVPSVLLIVGNGIEADGINQLIMELNLQNDVNAVGYVNTPECIYMVSDLLILMSDTEGTPRCVLEAMSYGIPVAATDVGGIKEIIQSGVDGIILHDNDPEHSAESIVSILNDDKTRKEMGTRAKNKIEEEFSISKMQSDIEGVYNYLLEDA